MKIYNNNLQESEYKILSEINHPSIPKIIDFFIYEENSISILEFFEGKTLGRIIEESNSFSLEKASIIIFKYM